MRPPRFTIGRLLLFTALLGIGIAALRSPSPLWANAWFSVVLMVLTIAPLAAIYRRGERRAFWVGFASCGSLYLVLALSPWCREEVSPRLVTTALLDLLYGPFAPPGPIPAAIPPPAGFSTMPDPLSTLSSPMYLPGTQGGPRVLLASGEGPVLTPSPNAAPVPPTNGDGSISTVPAAPEPPPLTERSGEVALIPPPGPVPPPVPPGPFTTSVPTPIALPTTWESWTAPDHQSGVGETLGGITLWSPEPFRRIGHCQFTLLFAALGGVLTRRLHATRHEPETPETV